MGVRMYTDGDLTEVDAVVLQSAVDILSADSVEATVEETVTAVDRCLAPPDSVSVYLTETAEDEPAWVLSTAEDGIERRDESIKRDSAVWTAMEAGDVVYPESRVAVVPVEVAGALRIEGVADPAEPVAEVLAETTVHALRDRCLIDEQRDRIQRLEDETENLREFASIVSHDLRNPLSVARGHLELALETGDDEHVRKVREAHDRIESIIEHTLSLASHESELQLTAMPLEALARRSWESVDTEAATLDIDSSRAIEGDAERLRQLFENLFRNAIEHGVTDSTDSETAVTVWVGALPDGFYVEDNGPGIPEAEREAVFERGYTNAEEGTGIGLAIVADVAEEHDFDVTITDGSDGGARFEFTRDA
jgi:signal transduction histidine kinase